MIGSENATMGQNFNMTPVPSTAATFSGNTAEWIAEAVGDLPACITAGDPGFAQNSARSASRATVKP
jgi:hypothetical protein